MSDPWDTFSKTAQKTAEGDWDNERAHVPDGTYHAVCVRVGEPYDKANVQSGEMQTKFVAEFALTGKRLRGETATLPSFISLPPKYLDEGFLSEKSNLFKLLKAFGTDLDSQFMVDPPSWVDDELFCDVVVENQVAKGSTEETSWITKFMTCVCDDEFKQQNSAARTQPPDAPKRHEAVVDRARAARRQPVGAE